MTVMKDLSTAIAESSVLEEVSQASACRTTASAALVHRRFLIGS